MNTDALRNRCVAVTGADGFLGKHLVSFLEEECGCSLVYGIDGPRNDAHGLDLAKHQEFCGDHEFDILFHLAGHNGGLAFNLLGPADIFYRNTLMGLNVLEESRRSRVKKVVSVVASCGYGDNLCGVFPSRLYLKGEPHASVACHGYAKRNLQLASSYYRQQYGLHAVCACPTTLYGPGDNFDPQRTKVMGGMVKRFVDAVRAEESSVTVWGSGTPQREFLYVEDAVRLLVATAIGYDDSEMPINLGSGQEVSIKTLAEMVAKETGFKGEIEYDLTKPNGQHRKRLDCGPMCEMLDLIHPLFSFTMLERGIASTVAHYKSTLHGQ